MITSVVNYKSLSVHYSRLLISCYIKLKSLLSLINNSWFFLVIYFHSKVPSFMSPASANATSRKSTLYKISESS